MISITDLSKSQPQSTRGDTRNMGWRLLLGEVPDLQPMHGRPASNGSGLPLAVPQPFAARVLEPRDPSALGIAFEHERAVVVAHDDVCQPIAGDVCGDHGDGAAERCNEVFFPLWMILFSLKNYHRSVMVLLTSRDVDCRRVKLLARFLGATLGGGNGVLEKLDFPRGEPRAKYRV